ncbi:uncharacterized protein LOC129039048 [Pongo pygmaeus]|uniref:uncharacterized protein LOC112133808 n=1 Tax=Pongo abelii TaxID=9601 RepID=UPI0023E1E539|nr:uncharacterized protein LOC112133808 [Pongo abelii]XP_054348569.1 uncharacterized protein LOC129039048 [Pongo pygmaeus]
MSYLGGHVISTALTNEGFPDRILKMGGMSCGRELTKKKKLPRKVACQSSQCMGAGGKRAASVCISSLKLLKLLIRKHRMSLTSQANFCKMDSSLGALYGINKISQTSKHSIRHCRNGNKVKAYNDGGAPPGEQGSRQLWGQRAARWSEIRTEKHMCPACQPE